MPKWQLTAKDGLTWLRLNSVAQNPSDVRESVERLWSIREKINRSPVRIFHDVKENFLVDNFSNDWKSQYRDALAKGIELINSGDLDKLVLATRQRLSLKKTIRSVELTCSLKSSAN